MLITDFDYDLPLELIAQYPEEKRDEARLLVVDRQKDAVLSQKVLRYFRLSSAGRMSRHE